MNAENIYKNIEHFINIIEVEPPKDKKITVFCDDGFDEVGFCENTLFGEIGINMFIAKKWILQEDLERLLNV